MDTVDVRIFCEMSFSNTGYNAYSRRQVSPADIGRKLGLDEKTVRTRVNNMEKSGFIKYYQVMPNLALFGLRSMGSFRFKALNLATKHQVVQKFDGVPQLVEGYDYLGESVGATFAGTNSENVNTAAANLALRFELGRTALGERVVREPLSKLDGLDWRILREFRFDARAKMKSISQALGVTARMVEYRTSKLTTSGAILVHAVIDVKKQTGLVFYELDVSMSEDKQSHVVRKVRELYSEQLWNFTTPTPGRLVASFFGFSLGEPEDVTLAVRKIDGVKTCDLFLLKEAVEPRKPNWIDRLIDSAIESPTAN